MVDSDGDGFHDDIEQDCGPGFESVEPYKTVKGSFQVMPAIGPERIAQGPRCKEAYERQMGGSFGSPRSINKCF